MRDAWLQDIESLEAISQDADARRILLKMAAITRAGRMGVFLDELAADDEVDDDTKGKLAELGSDPSFLFALEDYLCRTQRFH